MHDHPELPKPELQNEWFEKVNADLDKLFTYHAPGEKAIAAHGTVRQFGKDFALLVTATCPPSRERSLAITKIEETVMWANAAIARHKNG